MPVFCSSQPHRPLEARNAYLESELRRVERDHTNALKDNIVLKKQAGGEAGKATRAASGQGCDIP